MVNSSLLKIPWHPSSWKLTVTTCSFHSTCHMQADCLYIPIEYVKLFAELADLLFKQRPNVNFHGSIDALAQGDHHHDNPWCKLETVGNIGCSTIVVSMTGTSLLSTLLRIGRIQSVGKGPLMKQIGSGWPVWPWYKSPTKVWMTGSPITSSLDSHAARMRSLACTKSTLFCQYTQMICH